MPITFGNILPKFAYIFSSIEDARVDLYDAPALGRPEYAGGVAKAWPTGWHPQVGWPWDKFGK